MKPFRRSQQQANTSQCDDHPLPFYSGKGIWVSKKERDEKRDFERSVDLWDERGRYHQHTREFDWSPYKVGKYVRQGIVPDRRLIQMKTDVLREKGYHQEAETIIDATVNGIYFNTFPPDSKGLQHLLPNIRYVRLSEVFLNETLARMAFFEFLRLNNLSIDTPSDHKVILIVLEKLRQIGFDELAHTLQYRMAEFDTYSDT